MRAHEAIAVFSAPERSDEGIQGSFGCKKLRRSGLDEEVIKSLVFSDLFKNIGDNISIKMSQDHLGCVVTRLGQTGCRAGWG